MPTFFKKHTFHSLVGSCLFGAACAASAAAPAAYPCRTLTLVSPYPPGGTTDILARMLAPGG